MATRAYGTGDLRDAITTAGHLAVLKPKPLQPAVQGGFTVDGFTVGRQAGTVGCPGGHVRPVSTTGVATFGALCRTCPLRQQCTTSKTGRKIVLHDHDALLRRARRDWAADPALREAYRQHRPNVERGHLPARQPWRPPPEAALPGHRRQQRLAQAPHGCPQPAQPHRPWPHPPRRRLGAGHLRRQPVGPSASRPGACTNSGHTGSLHHHPGR